MLPVEARLVTAISDGIEISALDWGGDGPSLLLAHPNGFPAGVFDPLARELRDQFRPIAVDVRGNGASAAPADLASCTFSNGARDVLAVLDVLGITELVVLGHSMGGAVALIADSMRPGLLRKVLLCEAIAFPASEHEAGTGGGLAGGARKRRAVWPDRATVLASYGSRPPLAALDPSVLAAYVQYGFRDRDDGSIELECAPEVEATYFEHAGRVDGALRAFDHLAVIDAPVTVVNGIDTNLPRDWFEMQANAARTTRLEVPGSHFFVQEHTDGTAALVREHLAW